MAGVEMPGCMHGLTACHALSYLMPCAACMYGEVAAMPFERIFLRYCMYGAPPNTLSMRLSLVRHYYWFDS